MSYNELVERLVQYHAVVAGDALVLKDLDEAAKARVMAEGPILQKFHDETSHQLTWAGLRQLHSTLSEGHPVVFFRNNHFSTLVLKHSNLYCLVTDQGYLRQERIVWERLSEVRAPFPFPQWPLNVKRLFPLCADHRCRELTVTQVGGDVVYVDGEFIPYTPSSDALASPLPSPFPSPKPPAAHLPVQVAVPAMPVVDVDVYVLADHPPVLARKVELLIFFPRDAKLARQLQEEERHHAQQRDDDWRREEMRRLEKERKRRERERKQDDCSVM